MKTPATEIIKEPTNTDISKEDEAVQKTSESTQEQQTTKAQDKEVKEDISKEIIDIEKEHHIQEEIEKSHSKTHPIKEKAVNQLVSKMQNAKTVMIINIKGLPSKQFQEIKKAIRGHAEVLVAKKNILQRAIEKFGKKEIVPLENHIKENSAIVVSQIEGYELAGILAQKKTPVVAKAGQIAPEDIKVEAGPTDLVPGPAISELGAVGLQVAVKNGKLSIKVSRTIVKKGQEINEATASILQKLNILPFTVGLEPIVIYDVETGQVYTNIKVDSDEAKTAIVSAAGKALGFAQKIVYFCKETIGYLLAKANAEQEALAKLSPSPKEEEKEEEKPTETATENTDNLKEDEAMQKSSKSESTENKAEESKPEEPTANIPEKKETTDNKESEIKEEKQNE